MGTSQPKQSELLAGPEYTMPSDLFEALYQTFQMATQGRGCSIDERFYTIGGHTICLRFAGSALIPSITQALSHLTAEHSSVPSLTICLWDSDSTHTPMPPCPWSTDDFDARGEVHSYKNDCIQMAFHLGAGILSALNTESNLGLFWIRNAHQVPYYRRAAPLLTILHWWMWNQGCQIVHAAAVGTMSGGVLLAGRSYSGKSTTALACLHSKLLYAGDDYVLICAQPTPFVYSLYNSVKVEPNNIQKFPHLLSGLSNADRLSKEKALIFLHDYCPEKVTIGFPVRAVLLPRTTGIPETRIERASPGASLLSLAPNTVFRLPGARQRSLQNVANFVKQIPSYYLELGTDLDKIPSVIMSLLSEN